MDAADGRLARIKSRFLDSDEEDTDWQYGALAETIAIAEHYKRRAEHYKRRVHALEAQAEVAAAGEGVPDYRVARGCLPMDPDAEPSEVVIRRSRDEERK